MAQTTASPLPTTAEARTFLAGLQPVLLDRGHIASTIGTPHVAMGPLPWVTLDFDVFGTLLVAAREAEAVSKAAADRGRQVIVSIRENEPAHVEGVKRVSIVIVVDDGISSPPIPTPFKRESDLLH